MWWNKKLLHTNKVNFSTCNQCSVLVTKKPIDTGTDKFVNCSNWFNSFQMSTQNVQWEYELQAVDVVEGLEGMYNQICFNTIATAFTTHHCTNIFMVLIIAQLGSYLNYCDLLDIVWEKWNFTQAKIPFAHHELIFLLRQYCITYHRQSWTLFKRFQWAKVMPATLVPECEKTSWLATNSTKFSFV